MFGLFRSKQPAVPSAAAEPARYKGKPLLILLENYVLSCIDALPAEAEAGVAQAVQKGFGGDADWKKTLRERLQLSDGLEDHIRELWKKNTAIAAQRKEQLHPVQFAKMVADTNFVQLL